MITATIIEAEPTIIPITFNHPNGFKEASVMPTINSST